MEHLEALRRLSQKWRRYLHRSCRSWLSLQAAAKDRRTDDTRCDTPHAWHWNCRRSFSRADPIRQEAKDWNCVFRRLLFPKFIQYPCRYCVGAWWHTWVSIRSVSQSSIYTCTSTWLCIDTNHYLSSAVQYTHFLSSAAH
jgi:hypothetical protein